MKLLGLGCGRKMGNSEILLKEALMAAENTGSIEVEIIRLWDLNIKPCTGCERCTLSMSQGGTGGCWQKDDMPFLKEKFTECDGFIISAPVFELRPPGLYCIMNDRFLGFGPTYLMDVFRRPKRAGALISVGGSDWVQLGMPQMNLAMFMLNFKVVDQLQEMWTGLPGHTLFHDDIIARANQLGRNVADAMKKPAEEMKYKGDDPGLCPYCHSNLLLARGKHVVECPICALRGELRTDRDEIAVDWFEEDIRKIKWEPLGMGEHLHHIMERHIYFQQNKDTLKEKLTKYKSYKPYSKPARKAKGS